MSEHSIIVIDGSKASRAIITKSIRENIDNVTVTDFDSAASALSKCKTSSSNPDLIITAMSLPDMKGQDFASKLRYECCNSITPVILMSGDFIQNIENNTASPHINGYFDKSKGNEHLIGYIRSYLSQNTWLKSTNAHVLYVEDSPTVTRVVTNMLETNGYTYQHVNNASDALMLLTNPEKPFDLMLTDIQLEGLMSGDDLIREIRFGLCLSAEKFPILVSTSANTDRMAHINKLISSGANDVIEKPLIESLLMARLNNLTRRK